MKKVILAVWFLCLALGVTAQQTKKLTITKVKKGEEPKAVMDAIKRDFPSAAVKDLSFLPPKLYGEQWNIALEGDQFDVVDYYQVSAREPGKDEFTAVYDKNGNLLSSKRLIHNVPLPAEVMASLEKFKGWHIDKTHEIIKYQGKKTSDIFRVKLEKGDEHKIVYLDPAGNIINTRFTLM